MREEEGGRRRKEGGGRREKVGGRRLQGGGNREKEGGGIISDRTKRVLPFQPFAFSSVDNHVGSVGWTRFCSGENPRSTKLVLWKSRGGAGSTNIVSWRVSDMISYLLLSNES